MLFVEAASVGMAEVVSFDSVFPRTAGVNGTSCIAIVSSSPRSNGTSCIKPSSSPGRGKESSVDVCGSATVLALAAPNVPSATVTAGTVASSLLSTASVVGDENSSTADPPEDARAPKSTFACGMLVAAVAGFSLEVDAEWNSPMLRSAAAAVGGAAKISAADSTVLFRTGMAGTAAMAAASAASLSEERVVDDENSEAADPAELLR